MVKQVAEGVIPPMSKYAVKPGSIPPGYTGMTILKAALSHPDQYKHAIHGRLDPIELSNGDLINAYTGEVLFDASINKWYVDYHDIRRA